MAQLIQSWKHEYSIATGFSVSHVNMMIVLPAVDTPGGRSERARRRGARRYHQDV